MSLAELKDSSPRVADAGVTPARRNLLKGVAVSSGIAIGRALFVNRRMNLSARPRIIQPAEVEDESARLDQAVRDLALEFEEAKVRLGPEAREQAGIIDAHIMICRDPKFIGRAGEFIREKLFSAEWALEKSAQSVLAVFEAIDAPYMRERAEDVKTVWQRLLALLQGQRSQCALIRKRLIMFAHNLTPADALALDASRILALVTEMGGRTSHTGIMARSMGIPCVVGVNNLEGCLCDGDLVVVDGISGLILINPHEAELAGYIEKQEQFEAYETRIREAAVRPAETEDGVRVSIYGNIEAGSDTDALKQLGGEGVGLYRTEFGFISRRELPTEAELYEDYLRVLADMAPQRVVLRTLDVGSDKMLGQRRILKEENPALGLRAIRFCLRHQDIFRRQLRAILRASVQGNAAVMFPMISGLKELRLAKSILSEVKQELDHEGIPYDRDLPVGIMIELPSAVFTAGDLAREADFFSLGTNDLIQYSLGIDRDNKYVAYLYQPLHPAIIHAIKHVVDMAHQAGISVSVCGEMAADPYCIPLLLGMGIDEFSMTPQVIPAVKNLIRRSDTGEFQRLLDQVFRSAGSDSILRLVRQSVYARYQEELSYFNSMADTDF